MGWKLLRGLLRGDPNQRLNIDGLRASSRLLKSKSHSPRPDESEASVLVDEKEEEERDDDVEIVASNESCFVADFAQRPTSVHIKLQKPFGYHVL